MNEYFLTLKKYNFWEGNPLNAGYIREEYKRKILSYTNNRLIKVLVGQRRTGKSYLLRQIALHLIETGVPPGNLLFINREFSDFDFLVQHEDLNRLIKLYLDEKNPVGKIYLFIDEIQSISGWEKVVNSYSQDYTIDCEIFISGSNSEMLSTELATLLSGRYISVEIFPFSYTEFLGITGQSRGRESYQAYITTGGLPELFSLSHYETKRNYVSSIRDTVLLRDIIQRHHIREPGLLEELFVFLINNASNLISFTGIVKYYKGMGRKISYDLISDYIHYIDSAFLIHRCDRYNIKGKETIGGNAKYYANDLSYRNYLYSGFGYGFGYQIENSIYLELRRAGYEVYCGNINSREVDFVAKRSDRLIYIQSCYLLADEETAKREYASLESINDNYEKYVVSLDDMLLPSNKGIKHIQAWNLEEVIQQ
ncbi:MAG: ATP-binding protein [Bacteroidia bacterium]|nr:ATP-binding protein [Bacteroidia bacterium]